MKTRLLVFSALFVAFCCPVWGAEVFSQDFENGLGPNESVFGNFSINDTNDPLNNGTMMMGHAEAYATLPSYSYYDLTLDLRGFEDVTMAFDFTGGIEAAFDGFNLLASTTGSFSPPDGLLDPTGASELQYGALTIHGASSPELGPDAWSSSFDSEVESVGAAFDLGAFSENKVTIRFQFGTDAAAWGDGANFDNIVVEGTALPDTDGDGMPDGYEDANGQDKTVDDREGDLDGDTLTNIQEFALCSDPQKVDTDEDGLADSVETGTGEWVSATNTGTSPVRADTDGDGLADGAETNTGAFVSETDAGSDPHKPDTDGDSAKDGFEVACGSSPVDPLDSCSNFRGNGNFTITHVWTSGDPQISDAGGSEAVFEDPGDAEIIEVQYPYIHFHDNAAPPASLTFDQESRPYPIWDEDNGGDDVGFGDRNDFAILVEGQIWVNVTGTATFVCNSDDGFVLEIDGEEIGQAGNRGRGDTIMTAELTAGPHDFKFIHWERGGGAGVTLAAYRGVGDAPAPNPEDWILLRAYEEPPGEPALIIEEGVLGNQEFEGALGMDFVVNLPIQVFELGAFDSEGDELARPITVELWSRDDGGTPDVFDDDAGGEILASLEFEGDDGTLEGGTRFSLLEEPIVLNPGAYTIVGWGYGPDEQNYNVGGRDAEAEGLTITGSEFITFVGGSRFGDPGVNGEWPTSLDGGPENRYGAGNFKFGSTGDTDGDGMADAWEDLYELDKLDPSDASEDADEDGLTNLEEFKNGTLPKVADTDEDGLKDGVETGTGIWVSAEDTGTNPKKEDTDGDTLKDGVETNTNTFVSTANTGTDPNKKDSDGGGVGDGTEVAGGFDPTDPTDEPGCESPILNGGSIAEFTSPDDLHLDPATVLIAVDVYGDQIEEGRNVNGVTFFTDRCDECGDTEGLLEVEGGVTFKAESTHFIDGWATPPDFSGGEGDSAEELSGIMEDIRWSAAPSELTVDIEGLQPGVPVEVQMLFNEGADRNRRWDIAVEDELTVDDFTSEGCRGDSGGVWSPENSFVYTFEAAASGDGILNIVLQQDIGGEPSPGGDNNPILQGVIVHRAGPGRLFQVTAIAHSATEVTLTWASSPGREYSVEYNADLSNDIWLELDDGVQSEGEETSFTDDDGARTGLSEGWYRIRQN